jgi:hypothetical protein
MTILLICYLAVFDVLGRKIVLYYSRPCAANEIILLIDSVAGRQGDCLILSILEVSASATRDWNGGIIAGFL